ncbi:MAG: tRNA (adenosine(37)-N6)-threonylcarbamoyltransferase complex dimerization subunit type 1 TsaB [Arachnia sp.]
MTWTLGIDTSHEVAVGLAHGNRPVARLVVPDTRAHGEALMPTVVEVCRRHSISVADLGGVAVGMGPGPFTGLRVGIVAAEALAFALGITLHRVCSLDVLAQQWQAAPPEFIVAADARRRELYWARYAAGRRVGEPHVSAPGALPGLPLAGAVPEHAAQLPVTVGAPVALDPAVLAARYAELPPAPAEPYYLRPADATVGGPPKSTLPRARLQR